MVIEAQLTVMSLKPVPPVGVESPEPSLVVVKLAWLEILPVPHVVLPVWLVMWTVKLAPEANPVGPQVMVMGLVTEKVQTGVAGVWVSTLQDRPVLAGTMSVMVKPVASPGPALEAVIV